MLPHICWSLKISYTPGQNVWSGSKSVVTFGLIKISTNPCYLWPLFMGLSKSIFFLKKIDSKMATFFKPVNFQYSFVILSCIGPWVCRINWCKGNQCDSTNMVIRLSDLRPKTGKKHKECIFACFRPHIGQPDYWLSHIDAFCINSSYWPKDQF